MHGLYTNPRHWLLLKHAFWQSDGDVAPFVDSAGPVNTVLFAITWNTSAVGLVVKPFLPVEVPFAHATTLVPLTEDNNWHGALLLHGLNTKPKH